MYGRKRTKIKKKEKWHILPAYKNNKNNIKNEMKIKENSGCMYICMYVCMYVGANNEIVFEYRIYFIIICLRRHKKCQNEGECRKPSV